jgi:acyl-CoA thioesterase I
MILSTLTACAPEKMDGSAEARQPSIAQTDAAAQTANAGIPTVLFFGTSLTAGYGLSADRAFPAQIEQLARRAKLDIRAINAGLSGETSAGALRRIEWVLRSPADVVVIETGANDGLRALDVEATHANISRLVEIVQHVRPDARVLLVQMEAPPNFGGQYTSRFRNMYAAVAREKCVTLVPFLLEGVAGEAGLNQADGLHPNLAGTARVAENVWSALRPVIERIRAEGAARPRPARTVPGSCQIA